MEHSNFYIYGHFTNNGRIYYIGKGRGKRLFRLKRSNNREHNHQRKHYGCIPLILIENLTEDQAFEVEINLISKLKKQGIVLVNQTNGGEGVSGYKHTDISKQQLSESLKKYYINNKPWNYNKSLSEEHINKLKETHKGVALGETHRINLIKAIKFRYDNDKDLRNSHAISKGTKAFVCDQTQEEFINISEASRILKVSRGTIKNILLGKATRSKLTFRYL